MPLSGPKLESKLQKIDHATGDAPFVADVGRHWRRRLHQVRLGIRLHLGTSLQVSL
jgi:hypothetical protein